MSEPRKCLVCGKIFTPTRERRKICSDRCKKANRKKRVLKDKSLVEIAVAARKAGMTYGQYVAKMESGRRR